MKVTYKGKNKVLIEMTVKQLDSLTAVFESFTDQVEETNKAYGDCVVNIDKLSTAIGIANATSESAGEGET